MRKKVWTETPYGKVPVEVLECDVCHAQEAEATAVGWLEIAPAGVQVKTLGAEPHKLTVCGETHALAALGGDRLRTLLALLPILGALVDRTHYEQMQMLPCSIGTWLSADELRLVRENMVSVLEDGWLEQLGGGN